MSSETFLTKLGNKSSENLRTCMYDRIEVELKRNECTSDLDRYLGLVMMLDLLPASNQELRYDRSNYSIEINYLYGYCLTLN